MDNLEPNEHALAIRRLGVYPVFLAVGGSKLYGTDGPTSDTDVHGVYAEPAVNLWRFRPPEGREKGTIDTMLPDGTDVRLHEIKKALMLIGNDNATVVETLLSEPFFEVPLAGEAKPGIAFRTIQDAARARVSPDLADHYLGIVSKMEVRPYDRKWLIHSILTGLRGYVFLLTGELVFPWKRLFEVAGFHVDAFQAVLEAKDVVPNEVSIKAKNLGGSIARSISFAAKDPKECRLQPMTEERNKAWWSDAEDLLIRSRSGILHGVGKVLEG